MRILLILYLSISSTSWAKTSEETKGPGRIPVVGACFDGGNCEVGISSDLPYGGLIVLPTGKDCEEDEHNKSSEAKLVQGTKLLSRCDYPKKRLGIYCEKGQCQEVCAKPAPTIYKKHPLSERPDEYVEEYDPDSKSFNFLNLSWNEAGKLFVSFFVKTGSHEDGDTWKLTGTITDASAKDREACEKDDEPASKSDQAATPAKAEPASGPAAEEPSEPAKPEEETRTDEQQVQSDENADSENSEGNEQGQESDENWEDGTGEEPPEGEEPKEDEPIDPFNETGVKITQPLEPNCGAVKFDYTNIKNESKNLCKPGMVWIEDAKECLPETQETGIFYPDAKSSAIKKSNKNVPHCETGFVWSGESNACIALIYDEPININGWKIEYIPNSVSYELPTLSSNKSLEQGL